MTGAEQSQAGIETLYPFLYSGRADLDAVLMEVRRSTEEKVAEIIALREQVAGSYAEQLVVCADKMAEAFSAGGRLFTFGNGGSSSDAHAVAHLFIAPGAGARAVPATALTADIAVVTALSNDIGFDVVFARQLAAFGTSADIAMGLSTSGGSANVLAGFDQASRQGMLTIGLAGYDGGKMAEADTIEHLFVVPSPSVHRIQEAQTTVYNVLWELTQQALTGRSS